VLCCYQGHLQPVFLSLVGVFCMTDQASNKSPIPSKMVEVHWAESGLAVFANNLIAQFDGTSIHLTFAQINPPLIVGTTDAEKQKQLDKISSVMAMPVARLVVPLENFRNMVRALQEQLDQVDRVVNP
jgi:hypothetical protein